MTIYARVLDTNQQPIAPIECTGTVAQHYAYCVNLAVDLLNGAPQLNQLFKPFQGIQPGKIAYAAVSEESAKQLAFTMFISELHKHPGLDPDTFLNTWQNKNIPELATLFNNQTNAFDESLSLFKKIIEKVKIPGVGESKLIEGKSQETKKVEPTTSKPNPKKDDQGSSFGFKKGFLL